MALSVFPIAVDPSVRYTNDYGYERPDGRVHQGIDIFADEGTSVLAPDDGQVRFGTDPIGGIVYNLTGNDGSRYYGAHLSRVEGSNRAVRAGDIIGYVGRTGNAASTEPHLHFEVGLPGAGKTNPFPLLNAAERRGAGGGFPWLLALGAAGAGYWLLRDRQSGLKALKRLRRRYV